MNDRVLVIAASFSPTRTAGAARPSRLVARLGEHGWSPTVVAASTECVGPVETRPQYPGLANIEVLRAPCRSLWRHSTDWREAKTPIRRAALIGARALTRLTLSYSPTDAFAPWIASALPIALRAVRAHRPTLIWATAPWASTHALAALVSRLTGVPYVLDFRDVRRAQAPGVPTALFRRIMKGAAGITTCAPAQFNALCAQVPEVHDTPHALITNWFDTRENPVVASPPFEGPTILHGGSLYAGVRRLEGLVSALSLLKDREEGAVRLVNFGPTLDSASLSDGGALVEARPSVDAAVFRGACRQADVLLVVVGHNTQTAEHEAAIPGKLYEYFAAQRPILVVGPTGCAAGEMVTRLGRGVFVPDDAPQRIATAIEALLRPRLDLSLDAVAAYSAEHAVARFADFFTELGQSTSG